ncbi:mevalonate kinase [archaeon]|nr:mevalonate kinase [archaeon]
MSGIGYGKVILFGEHFVVYGLEGIAASVEMNTTCEYEENGNGIVANDLVTGELITLGKDREKRLGKVLEVILKDTKIKEKNFRLKLSTNMSLKGGMGSSAALGVAITRCLDEKFSLELNNERINEIAYNVEKLFHGNPSGIDDAVSTYGGLLSFKRREGKNEIEKIPLEKPIEIVLADTGIFHDTAEIVEMIRNNKEKEPQKYERIFKEYSELVKEGRNALNEKNWEKIGELMNKNQELLKEMGVSCKELDLLVETALEQGALGAKLTGAGIGGNMIALTPGEELQEKVAKACKELGFKIYKTRIGVK